MASSRPLSLLLCGSFNPVTNHHLRMFELARDALNKTGYYHVVEGIISPVSDKYEKKGLAESRHRIEMVKRAVSSSSWIRCDEWEANQPHWSPTVQVLRHHRTQLQEQPQNNHNDSSGHASPQLKFLCGADVLETFEVPGVWAEVDKEEILRDFGIVCISRGGADIEKFIYETDLLSNYKHNINLVKEWINNDVSATKIRRALKRGESVRYLLQDSVIEYINEHGLYGTDKVASNDVVNTSNQNSSGQDTDSNTLFWKELHNLGLLESLLKDVKNQVEHDFSKALKNGITPHVADYLSQLVTQLQLTTKLNNIISNRSIAKPSFLLQSQLNSIHGEFSTNGESKSLRRKMVENHTAPDSKRQRKDT